jgi:hypothetical protein
MADEKEKEAAKAAEEQAKAARKSREEQLKAERKAADEAHDEQVERVAKLRPTPTQEENDRAKLGLNSLEDLDNKEPHGAPEEKQAPASGAAGTLNRSVSTK